MSRSVCLPFHRKPFIEIRFKAAVTAWSNEFRLLTFSRHLKIVLVLVQVLFSSPLRARTSTIGWGAAPQGEAPRQAPAQAELRPLPEPLAL
jgi:hypothetical protein